MILAFINMLTWVPLVMVFILSQYGIAPVWVAVLWLINIMPAMLLSFQKDNWLSNMVPGQSMGRYLGQRLAIKSGFYLAAFFLFGYLMDSLGKNNLASFGLVFLAATVMTFVYFYIYTHMHDPVKPAKEASPVKAEMPKIKFGLFDFIGDLKQKKLDKFVLFTSLINVSIGLSAPFYAVYMLQEKSFSYMSFTIVISVEFLARVVSGPFWGRFADKAGNIKVLTIVSRIVPALPICWLFSTNIAYLAAIQIISGICWGAFDLSTQSYLYKVAPPPRKLHYIVFTRSLMLFSVAVGGLLGSFLVKDIFLTFGSRLLSVFMISGFIRAIAVMFLMPKLIDLAVNYGKTKKSTINLELVKKAAASRNGLFYSQPEPAIVRAQSPMLRGNNPVLSENIRQTHVRKLAMEERLARVQEAKRELMELTEAVRKSGRRNWAAYEKSAEEKAARPAAITPSRRPWYGDSEIQAAYNLKNSAVTAAGMKLSAVKQGSREGLFYNDAGWARYMKETLREVVREKEGQKAAVNRKPVIIEKRNPVLPVVERSYRPLTGKRELVFQKIPVIA